MRARAGFAPAIFATAVLVCACASEGTIEIGGRGPDASGPDAGSPLLDGAPPASDALADDSSGGGKSCEGLPDGTVCGPALAPCLNSPVCQSGVCANPSPRPDGTTCGAAPDACHAAPTCSGGVCGSAAALPDGTVCAKAADGCHSDATCKTGNCGASGTLADGHNWSAGDATAICCGGHQVHADTNGNCGACGIACNAGNGESCALLGGHYFCRGCVASAACWSKCCSESFTPFSCAASDCSGNCSATYCPPGTHCVSGAPNSSDYCAY